MPASRARILVPVLLLLVVVAVVAGLLVGNRTDDTASGPAATTAPPATEPPATEPAPAAEPTAPTQAQAPDLTRRVEGDPMAAGPVDAPVGVVVYSDYSCPYCQSWAVETQPTVLEYAEEGTVRLEWRDVSILGEDSTRAAVAAAAAAEQGRYREFHELLFADMDARSPEQLAAMAEQLGLDVEQFTADLTDPDVLAGVQRTMDEAQSLGLQSTPSFVVAGTPVVGAQPAEVFVELIEAALAP
ncbi:Protein-disulfide isomerase [Georgenia satyanarayanai]|uniref:Protein-disulfide isomerase n=1 Tax=Georgenia satyanarayanai TaxID=860221 RepID=A0A2Y9C0L5_9MICO|nr:thioredoxin domain-containing protein [Georgenia satyanarayanai]PYF96786.1 protein-disulfide isomerase [Georgenia satyanarayanai]SSA46382.1 Protein-disulfide isomerase [Georgenia satyanarayanai]